jgi:putative nucleotidyltransferase with HDIG domain
MRNPHTHGHCRRVARHAERIARAMHLGAAEVAEVRTAALIHDVGKVYTPADILHKPGPLTDEEFEVIKRHCVDGADMLSPVRDSRLAAIVRHHHERLDGSGYPDGLEGEEIPLAARIIAVADTFDAITSHRPYRRARSQQDGLAVLAAEAGGALDPDAVEAFLHVYSPRRAIASASLSAAAWGRLAPTQLLPGALFGSAPLAAVLPAVGTAGLLALSPAARYEKTAAEPRPVTRASVFTASFPADLAGASTGPRRAVAHSPGTSSQPSRQVVKDAPSGRGGTRRARVPREPAGPEAAVALRSSATAGGGPAEALPGSPSVALPVLPAEAHVPTPRAPAPGTTTPSAAATTSAPAAGTATLPGLSAGTGGVTSGPAGAGGAEAGPVTAPSATLGGLAVPAPSGSGQ